MEEIKLEAVVLAGGKGTRLAPLTEDTPKPLLKLMGKTVLETVLERVKECAPVAVRVTTMYLPWQIEALGSPCAGLSVEYVRETAPLGTAGAVKNACDGACDHVLVLSGDGAHDFDLKKALDYHLEKDADVTIVTYKTEDPSEYGVVLYDERGRIRRFAEKPPWSQVVSGTVNTGIYIMKREILERIPANTAYDFGKQLFPLLLASGAGLYAYEAEGEWHDIGTLDEYYAAVCAALDGKLCGLTNDGVSAEQLRSGGIEVEEPVYVSPDAVLGKNVKLGAYTVIGAAAVVSDGCDVACSVLGDGVTLGMGCGIYGTLIGRGAKLGENCVTSEGCVIGGGAQIEDSAILPKYSLIHSGMHVAGSELVTKRIGRKELVLFGEDGIDCEAKHVTPDFLVRLGLCIGMQAVSRGEKGVRVGVLCANTSTARRVKAAVLCGLMHTEARCVDLGVGFDAMARFAALTVPLSTTVYIGQSDGESCKLCMYDDRSFPVSAAYERAFGNLFYSAGDYREPTCFYEPEVYADLAYSYRVTLLERARKLRSERAWENTVLVLKSSAEDGTPSKLVADVLSELGVCVKTQASEAAPLPFDTAHDRKAALWLDENGNDVTFDFDGTRLDRVHMDVLLLKNGITANSTVYLPDSPTVYRTLARRKNIPHAVYTAGSAERPDATRAQMLEQLWLDDCVFKAIYLFAALNASEDANAMLGKLPAFAVYTHYVEGTPNRAGVMQQLSKRALRESGGRVTDGVHDGVCLEFEKGRVTVIPGKATGFRVISEALSMEAAEELGANAEEYLK